MALHALSLCAGVEGLGLGLQLALGDAIRTVAYVEREAFAAAALVARMEEATLDRAPIWDDVVTFDGRPWRGVVDLVTAGFPCPPFSQAGLRLGAEDFRYLWPDVLAVIRDVGPSLVFVENVADFAIHPDGLRRVVGDLAEAGFDTEWDSYSATETGATQGRERIFVLAHSNDVRCEGFRWQPEHDGDARDDADRSSRAPLVLADSGRGMEWTWAAHAAGPAIEPQDAGSDRMGDTAGAGLPVLTLTRDGQPAVRDGEEEPRRRGSALPLFPPGPDDLGEWFHVLERAPCLEPSVRRVADGLADRMERLHATGNGVVPLMAALAFVRLADALGLIETEA